MPGKKGRGQTPQANAEFDAYMGDYKSQAETFAQLDFLLPYQKTIQDAGLLKLLERYEIFSRKHAYLVSPDRAIIKYSPQDLSAANTQLAALKESSTSLAEKRQAETRRLRKIEANLRKTQHLFETQLAAFMEAVQSSPESSLKSLNALIKCLETPNHSLDPEKASALVEALKMRFIDSTPDTSAVNLQKHSQGLFKPLEAQMLGWLAPTAQSFFKRALSKDLDEWLSGMETLAMAMQADTDQLQVSARALIESKQQVLIKMHKLESTFSATERCLIPCLRTAFGILEALEDTGLVFHDAPDEAIKPYINDIYQLIQSTINLMDKHAALLHEPTATLLKTQLEHRFLQYKSSLSKATLRAKAVTKGSTKVVAANLSPSLDTLFLTKLEYPVLQEHADACLEEAQAIETQVQAMEANRLPDLMQCTHMFAALEKNIDTLQQAIQAQLEDRLVFLKPDEAKDVKSMLVNQEEMLLAYWEQCTRFYPPTPNNVDHLKGVLAQASKCYSAAHSLFEAKQADLHRQAQSYRATCLALAVEGQAKVAKTEKLFQRYKQLTASPSAIQQFEQAIVDLKKHVATLRQPEHTLQDYRTQQIALDAALHQARIACYISAQQSMSGTYEERIQTIQTQIQLCRALADRYPFLTTFWRSINLQQFEDQALHTFIDSVSGLKAKAPSEDDLTTTSPLIRVQAMDCDKIQPMQARLDRLIQEADILEQTLKKAMQNLQRHHDAATKIIAKRKEQSRTNSRIRSLIQKMEDFRKLTPKEYAQTLLTDEESWVDVRPETDRPKFDVYHDYLEPMHQTLEQCFQAIRQDFVIQFEADLASIQTNLGKIENLPHTDTGLFHQAHTIAKTFDINKHQEDIRKLKQSPFLADNEQPYLEIEALQQALSTPNKILKACLCIQDDRAMQANQRLLQFLDRDLTLASDDQDRTAIEAFKTSLHQAQQAHLNAFNTLDCHAPDFQKQLTTLQEAHRGDLFRAMATLKPQIKSYNIFEKLMRLLVSWGLFKPSDFRKDSFFYKQSHVALKGELEGIQSKLNQSSRG